MDFWESCRRWGRMIVGNTGVKETTRKCTKSTNRGFIAAHGDLTNNKGVYMRLT